MDVESGQAGRKRRGAPAAKSLSAVGSATAPNSAIKKSNKKIDGDIELRPLIASNSSNHEATTTMTGNTAGSAASSEAAKFADSWLGSMIKVKAKQGVTTAYNLRANLKSKKGFHVQVPKRMLFYTGLVFLIGPLILFLYKENHIHDHDPTYHDNIKNHNDIGSLTDDNYHLSQRHPNATADNSHQQHQHRNNSSHNTAERTRGHHPNNKIINNKHHPGHHPSLQQLLAGGISLNNATTTTTANSKSKSGTPNYETSLPPPLPPPPTGGQDDQAMTTQQTIYANPPGIVGGQSLQVPTAKNETGALPAPGQQLPDQPVSMMEQQGTDGQVLLESQPPPQAEAAEVGDWQQQQQQQQQLIQQQGSQPPNEQVQVQEQGVEAMNRPPEWTDPQNQQGADAVPDQDENGDSQQQANNDEIAHRAMKQQPYGSTNRYHHHASHSEERARGR